MRHLVFLGSVYLVVCSAQIIPDELRNYTHMISFLTRKPEFRLPTTRRPLPWSPGEDGHVEYVMNKYEREIGSQIGSDEFTFPTTQSPPPGQTFTKRVITITELETMDETYVPDHTVLQMIKELADKGMRVMAKLQTVNAEQNEENFPWKYMTEHKDYRQFRTSPPPSPASFANAEEKAAYKKKAEEETMHKLFKELKSALEIGEERKKSLMKQKTPSSAEEEQMREYYKQTKQWCEPVIVDYTTWDGGEGHVTMTAASVEREIKPHEKFKRYDTLEIYHEQKAKEAEEFENEDTEETQQRELTKKMTTRSSPTTTTTTTTTTDSQNFNGTVTVSWDSMSKIMWHYINQVTVHASDTSQTRAGCKNSTSPTTTEQTNKLLDDYLKYLTNIGETIEPTTANFLVERFPRRLSSEEIAKRKLYSKNPHFKERFTRRLDSVEFEKRRSRLSTPPTPGTWAYTTMKRNHTYSSREREGINEFFLLNNISTDPNYFGETHSHRKSNELKHTRDLNLSEPTQTSGRTSYSYVHQQNLTKEMITKSSPRAVDFNDKYKHIDVPMIQSSIEHIPTHKKEGCESERTSSLGTKRTLSYNELSSVVSYYAELLRIENKTAIYFDKSTPFVTKSQRPLVTSVTTTRKQFEPLVTSATTIQEQFKSHATSVTPFTTTEGHFSHEDAHAMTEAPIQHVFNLLFDPFRHDILTQAPPTPQEDNYQALLKSLGSSTYTETFHDETTELDHQLHCTNKITTPKVYSKADVYAMGHRTYVHGTHDPMWRSIYGRYKQSTTPNKKNNLMNIFDDPLGVYMRPDTEEINERKAEEEARAMNDSITIYPYWKELNKKYFASTLTIFPGQYTPRNENHTNVTESVLADEKYETRSTTEGPILSDENYIETRATTAFREWTGYNLETTTEFHDPFPDVQEMVKQLGKSERDPLDPEHILQKRIHNRELEDQLKLNEDDMPAASYLNLSFSDQICRDRAPALQFLDDSKQFESEGFKTLEGCSPETYDLMEKNILDEIEETRTRIAQRKLNKTRQEEEERRRMMTTTVPTSIEKLGLRMDNIKFNHLDDDYQQHDMQDFKMKLKEQFGVIYKHSSTTQKTDLTCLSYLPDTTESVLVVTNQGGKVIRKFKKIKRRKTTKYVFNTFSELDNEITPTLNNNTSHHEENHNQTHKSYEEEHLISKRIKRSASNAAECNENERGTTNTEASSMRSRRIERFQERKFSLPFETTEFTLPSTDRKEWDTIERKFHGGKSIYFNEVNKEPNPSLEKIIDTLTANLTEADLNKTITEEEREIDSVSEKYHKEFVGDIPGYDRDYDGNLVPTQSPAEVQKELDEFERKRIEYMRKARGEFDRYMSQETYDQLNEQRKVRIKHIDEYLDWHYQQEHQEELERRRKKHNTTKMTPNVEKLFGNDTTKVSAPIHMLSSRSRIVERFQNMRLTPHFETTTQTAKIREDTSQCKEISTADTSSKTDGTVIKAITKTELEDFKSTKHHFPQFTVPQNTIYNNTLVAQVLEYKRFISKYKTRKTKRRDFTRSVTYFNQTPKTKTSTTESPVYSYEDYNISTTVDILHGEHHGVDPLEHLTDIPLNVFREMKQDEADVYQRYHDGEISLHRLKEMREAIIAKYGFYTKSTLQYTHPKFNITASIYPTLGQVENYGDLKRAWKKVEAFEREMVTSNNTLYKEEFELAFTKFPPTIPPKRPKRRYKRQVLNTQPSQTNAPKRIRKSIFELNDPLFLLNQMAEINTKNSQNRDIKITTTNNSHTTISSRRLCSRKTSKAIVQRKHKDSELVLKETVDTRSTKLKQSKIKGNKSSLLGKSSKIRSQTKLLDPKEEIKVIQRKLNNLKKDLDMVKTNLRSVTLRTNKGENINEDTQSVMKKLSKISALANRSNSSLQTMPFLYARSGKNGRILKYELQLKQVAFENEEEKEEIKQKFVEKCQREGSCSQEQNCLVAWRNVTVVSEETEESSTSKDYEAELGTVHPHTLVTMVSDLYHQRMSMQNHIQYEPTTKPRDTNRTYLYEVFGFNTRTPKRVTRNVSVQFSMFQDNRNTIKDNYKRVSNIQYVLERYTKNLTIFSKNEQRHWDVFFYEKNIPQPRHPHGQVRWRVGYGPGDTRVVNKHEEKVCYCEECQSEYYVEESSDANAFKSLSASESVFARQSAPWYSRGSGKALCHYPRRYITHL